MPSDAAHVDGDVHDDDHGDACADADADANAAVEEALPVQSDTSQTHAVQKIEVVLTKGVCGLGIYFTAADGSAIVDRSVPFYCLPDGSAAPGEASGLVQAGDRLVRINSDDVRDWTFPRVVERLRSLPMGDVVLHLERGQDGEEDEEDASSIRAMEDKQDADSNRHSTRWQPLLRRVAAMAAPPSTSTPQRHAAQEAAMEALLVEMESRTHMLEEALERERKCRFLAEKKNILYRNALTALTEENTQLRYQLSQQRAKVEATRRFQQSLHLSV